jgi:hypothetical protein
MAQRLLHSEDTEAVLLQRLAEALLLFTAAEVHTKVLLTPKALLSVLYVAPFFFTRQCV